MLLEEDTWIFDGAKHALNWTHTPRMIMIMIYSLSHVWLFETPWTVACQASLYMEFSRLECESELPFPFPGDLPDPGIKPRSSALQANSLPFEPLRKLPKDKGDEIQLYIYTFFFWKLSDTQYTCLICVFLSNAKIHKCISPSFPVIHKTFHKCMEVCWNKKGRKRSF